MPTIIGRLKIAGAPVQAVEDQERYYLVTPTTCSCGQPDCLHHIETERYHPFLNQLPGDPRYCPECQQVILTGWGESFCLDVCPHCGWGQRRRIAGYKRYTGRRGGRRARTAVRYIERRGI